MSPQFSFTNCSPRIGTANGIVIGDPAQLPVSSNPEMNVFERVVPVIEPTPVIVPLTSMTLSQVVFANRKQSSVALRV